MATTIDSFLRAYPPHHEARERWPVQGEMIVRLGLGSELPPESVSSSILAIVFNSKREVLFLWPERPSGSIAHLLIGGRPEVGETPHQTAIREVGEETGWFIEPAGMIGFRHFTQLEPRNPRTDRPYPHFIQPIFAARALHFDVQLCLENDRIDAAFIALADVLRITDAAQHPLLHAAAAQL